MTQMEINKSNIAHVFLFFFVSLLLKLQHCKTACQNVLIVFVLLLLLLLPEASLTSSHVVLSSSFSEQAVKKTSTQYIIT